MSARSLALVRDVSCRLEGFGVSVGHVGSTACAKDVSGAWSSAVFHTWSWYRSVTCELNESYDERRVNAL